MNLIQKLFYSLTNKYLEGKVENSEWQKFGFQGNNPITDIRGGGVMAIKQMIYFSDHNYDLVIEMTQGHSDFYFGVSSIIVSFFIKEFFHLAEYLSYPKDREKICSRKALKNFL